MAFDGNLGDFQWSISEEITEDNSLDRYEVSHAYSKSFIVRQ